MKKHIIDYECFLEVICLITLRQGDTGPQVQLIQLALTRAGFPPRGGTDGIFGSGTAEALRSFQRSVSLVPDAVAGPLTWNALNKWLLGYTAVTIRSGDTMYKIARRFGTDVSSVMTANPNADPLNLRIGSNLTVPYGFDVVPDSIAFTSTLLYLCIRGLKARYPFITVRSAGKSVIGHDLTVITVGDSDKQLFLNASHHANEWITSLFAMKFLENYLKSISTGSLIGGFNALRLYSSVSYVCLPMVNPDGVDLVTGELGADSFYYQNALSLNKRGLPFPSGWKANIKGIDLNLQYPAGWETARRIKFAQGYTSPGPRDYVGPAPLTAPESRAVYDFTLANNFRMTLSYHTVGEVIYWKYNGFEPVNSRQYGEYFASVSGYDLELTPDESGYAGYKDWFIQDYNRPGYTIEAGTGSSPVPLSQLPRIIDANTPLVAAALNFVSGQ